jgi:hypothetical protein
VSCCPAPLWEWNGVDTTQFAAAALKPVFGAFTLTGAPALSVVARAEGNRLKLAVAGLAQQGVLIWPIAASLNLVLPMRYLVRFSMFATVNISGNVYTGVCYYTNGEVALNASLGINFLSNSLGGAGYQGVNSLGVYAATGATPAVSGQPNVINLEIRGQKVVAVQPGALVAARSVGVTGVESTLYFLTNAVYFANPFPAGWNAATEANLSQFGLAMHMNAAEANPFVEYGMLQILPHPLDW